MSTLAWFAVVGGIVVAAGLFVVWCCLVLAGRCERGQGQ